MSEKTPTISTPRLLLRYYQMSDVDALHKLIAASSHVDDESMSENQAKECVEHYVEQYDIGQRIVFALILKTTKQLVGSIDFTFNDPEDKTRAELGYWMGAPYREQGFCTEAARAMLKYGFEEMGLTTIYADHFIWNEPSGKVLQKIGMTYESSFEQFSDKWGMFMDVDRYIMEKKDLIEI